MIAPNSRRDGSEETANAVDRGRDADEFRTVTYAMALQEVVGYNYTTW